jgi:hypothetical protein
MKKITTVNIENRNAYPISLTLQTNNIRQTFEGIAPQSSKTFEYDWTTIEKREGEWIIVVCNADSKGCDSFAHGFFQHGELSSFADIISEGSQLKVKISE